MVVTIASSKHQVVIPKVIREKIKFHPKQRFAVEVRNGQILLRPLPCSLDDLKGSAKETFKKLGGGKNYLLKERSKW